jgi:sirohydrochlorin ferrochelatase
MLLDAVRRQRPDLVVHETYLDHSEPSLADLVLRLDGPFVVVPLLLGAAYHSRVDIPAALAPAVGRGLQSEVLGPDPLLLRALERHLDEVGVAAGDPDTAVVLAAAGSAEESSLAAVRRLAEEWREAGWWAVEAAFASAAAPTVEDAVTSLLERGAPRVVVSTYLLFPGRFADKIAYAATTAAASTVAGPLADAPEIVDLVLARYDAATRRLLDVLEA